jgi:hypothetical protein
MIRTKHPKKKKRAKVNFYIPEGINGCQFKKFLKRSGLHFFFPKQKEFTSADSLKVRAAIFAELSRKEINQKMKDGKLLKM